MTDERVDAALERAAEMVAVCEPMYILGFPQGTEAATRVMPDALEGWAEAIRLMGETRNKLRHVAAYLDRTGGDEENDHGFAFALRQDAKDLDNATAKFIRAMLGEIARGRNA